jgi:hypothetical protein
VSIYTCFSLSIITDLPYLFCSNIMMVPLAMGMGLPWGFYLPPMLAGMAMSFSSVSVVVSSLLLRNYQGPLDKRKSHDATFRNTMSQGDIPLMSLNASPSLSELDLEPGSPVSPLQPSTSSRRAWDLIEGARTYLVDGVFGKRYAPLHSSSSETTMF